MHTNSEATEKARKMWLAEVEVLDKIGTDIVKHQMSDEVITHVREDKNIKHIKRKTSYTFTYSHFMLLEVNKDGYSWRINDTNSTKHGLTKEQVIEYVNKTEYYTGSRDPIKDEFGNVSLPDYPDYKIFMDKITYEPLV